MSRKQRLRRRKRGQRWWKLDIFCNRYLWRLFHVSTGSTKLMLTQPAFIGCSWRREIVWHNERSNEIVFSKDSLRKGYIIWSSCPKNHSIREITSRYLPQFDSTNQCPRKKQKSRAWRFNLCPRQTVFRKNWNRGSLEGRLRNPYALAGAVGHVQSLKITAKIKLKHYLVLSVVGCSSRDRGDPIWWNSRDRVI